MGEEFEKLKKCIYGKMQKLNLPVTNELATYITDIATDYGVGINRIDEAIYRASKKYDGHFDYVTYIVYNLIIYSKERKHRGYGK